MTTTQGMFDIDSLIAEANPRPPYTGRAPLRFTTDYYTLEELVEAQYEARLAAGDDYCHSWRHMWHPEFMGVRQQDSNGHLLAMVECDLRCSCLLMPPYGYNTRYCYCPGDLICQSICETCAWHFIGTWNQAVEAWHDHAWAGWRELPILGLVKSGTDRAKQLAALVKEVEYPAEWMRAGAPIITDRENGSTRHVPDYSPWRGFDIAYTAVLAERVEAAA